MSPETLRDVWFKPGDLLAVRPSIARSMSSRQLVRWEDLARSMLLVVGFETEFVDQELQSYSKECYRCLLPRKGFTLIERRLVHEFYERVADTSSFANVA